MADARQGRSGPSAASGSSRRSRSWRSSPIGWSDAWFVIRDRTAAALDAWLAAEKRAGPAMDLHGPHDRRLSRSGSRCRCAALGVVSATGVTASLGPGRVAWRRSTSRATDRRARRPVAASTTAGVTRRREAGACSQASVARSTARRPSAPLPRRDAPRFGSPARAPEDVASRRDRFEAHLRPNPDARRAGGAPTTWPAVAGARACRPSTPSSAAPSRRPRARPHRDRSAAGFAGRPRPAELERWRAAGGKLDIVDTRADARAAPARRQGRARPRRRCTGRPGEIDARRGRARRPDRQHSPAKRPRRAPARRPVRPARRRRRPARDGGAGP